MSAQREIHAAGLVVEDSIGEHARRASARRASISSPRSNPISARMPRRSCPRCWLSTVTDASLTLWMSAIKVFAIVPGGNCAPKSLISRPVFGSHGATTQSWHCAFRSSFYCLIAPLAAQAQVPAVSGDAKRGESLAYTCNGCHAIPNYKNVYPTYSVPKLHGQRPEYLVAALKAYKSGERSHGTMHSQAASMSEQDMADVAVYLAGPEVLTVSKNDVPADQSPEGVRNLPRLPRHQRRRHHRRLPDHLRPASRLPRARAARLPEGRPQERRHGGHGRHAHARRHRSSSRLTTRARSRR